MSGQNRWVGRNGGESPGSGPHPRFAKAAGAGFFLLGHGFAAGITVLIPCVLWTAFYLLLIVMSLVMDGGLGSPVAYPLGLLFIVIGTSALVLLGFLPATALAEWISRKRSWSFLARIPLSIGLFALIVAFWGTILCLFDGVWRDARWWEGAMGVFFTGLLPFGLYWWASQGGRLALSGWRRLHAKVVGR
jgi:hypothetical protein